MWGNFDLIQERISSYSYVPDKQFRTSVGLTVQEANVEQKMRQYWADKSIPDAVKLEGFDLDLSAFDPENTSNKEMREIAGLLCNMGILDRSTGGWLDGVDLEFNSFGNEINIGKKTNLFANFDRHLEYYKKEIAAGTVILKDVQTSLYTAISVVLALQGRAKESRAASLIDAKV